MELTRGEKEMVRIALVREYERLKTEKLRMVKDLSLTGQMLDHYDAMLADIKSVLDKTE